MNMDEARPAGGATSPSGQGIPRATTQYRRSDFDVTNTVQVSSAQAVCRAVCELFSETWPEDCKPRLERAFEDFEQLYNGRFPGYHGCDTIYHDLQHSLDGTLAAARLLAAHDRSCPPAQQLGVERATVAVIVALYHDAGYIRRVEELAHSNGAEFTQSHVSRSAEYLRRYLPALGLAHWAAVAAQMVHYTGYEKKFDAIELTDHRDRSAGHLVGTGDLIAQMSDRCYLEKCRDRLYPEFVLGGVAGDTKYRSGLDVLRQTPEFIAETRRTRLDGEFGGAYRLLTVLFNGRNPYMEAIERNLDYLAEVLRTGNWPMLRRDPPCFTTDQNPLQKVRELMSRYLRRKAGSR